MTTEGYDYIVAGGGSSGCLVTARLAEAGARALLLEAGPDDQNPLIRMPAGQVKLLGVERYMWFYKSVPQAHLGGRTPIVPQGRVLGGGSSVNAMVYIRGQRGDYDEWIEATGDAGWGYASAMPAIISGNTNAAVLVVAEKAAEFLLGRAPRPAAPRAPAELQPAG